jgi:Tfp pilus assembly protein PilP
MRRAPVIIALAVGALAPVRAQGPAKPSAPAAPAPAAPAAAAPPTETYTYQSEGRRDPFLNLLGAGPDPRPAAARRPEGAAGLSVAEISVRGVLQSRDALVAMISGPDNRTYIVHQGDQLLDGTIKRITSEGLVVSQPVKDPLSTVKQRDVRKLLRSIEDGK